MNADNGPYDSERQARAAAHAIVPPEDGRSILRAPQCRQLLDLACEAAGVELGTYDERILDWISGFEDSACAVFAGLIRRAAEARPGTATEWGVRLEGSTEPFASGTDENDARQTAANFPRSKTEVVRREVGPWTPVSGRGSADG